MLTPRRSPALALLAALGLAAAAPIACSAGNDQAPAGSGAGTGTGASGSTSTGAGGSGGNLFGTGGGVLDPFTITPPSAIIDVVDGVSTPVDFDAAYGALPVDPMWVVDFDSIATVDGSGVVTATGVQGGQVTLEATYNADKAQALVTVNIKKLLNPYSVSPTDQATLKAAVDPDPGIVWAYPYDETVFPKGLAAPEMMWNNGGAGDLYYLHFVGKHVDIELFTQADPPSRVTLDPISWQQLTESGDGGAVNVKVARLVPGAAAATVVADHTWTIANGSLRGSVYYWANSLGRVLRIKPGAAAPEDFLAAGGQTGCSTCHAVSSNGSTLIIGGDIAVSTWDLLTNTPVLNIGNVGKPVRNWAMPAISPNGKVLVENNAPLPGPPGGSDGMFDALTGQKLGGTGLDGVFLDMPAFAPDGTKLAYVDHNTHGLAAYDFDAANTTVANQVSLVDMGGDPSWNAIAFPSVSPDAKWIVYHRGQYPNSLDTRFGPGALYLASTTQPGLEVRLGETNGDAYPFAAGDRDRNYNYEPTFAPLNSGGFAWVVFTSRRTYGNRLTGTKDEVKQLWVTAIDQDPAPGADPSHPAFWVTGQDLATLNMRGYWALDPCKQVGEGCSTGSECCNKNCVGGVCDDPDPSGCSGTGNVCTTSADCCDPLDKCINGICSEPPPQ